MSDTLPKSQRLAESKETLLVEIQSAENDCAMLRLDVEDQIKGADKKLEAARAHLRKLREELDEIDRAIPIARDREEQEKRREAKRRGRERAKVALERNEQRTQTAADLSKALDRVATLIRQLHHDSELFWADCREAWKEGEVLGIDDFGIATPRVEPFPSALFERAFIGVPFKWIGYQTRWPFERSSNEVSGDPNARMSLAEHAKMIGEHNDLIIRTGLELVDEYLGDK